MRILTLRILGLSGVEVFTALNCSARFLVHILWTFGLLGFSLNFIHCFQSLHVRFAQAFLPFLLCSVLLLPRTVQQPCPNQFFLPSKPFISPELFL